MPGELSCVSSYLYTAEEGSPISPVCVMSFILLLGLLFWGGGSRTYRYVYFQVSCEREGSSPSVGVGLSTPEMPLSTLVGAFSNSVGLCSTGQVTVTYGELSKAYALRLCFDTASYVIAVFFSLGVVSMKAVLVGVK